MYYTVCHMMGFCKVDIKLHPIILLIGYYTLSVGLSHQGTTKVPSDSPRLVEQPSGLQSWTILILGRIFSDPD